MEHTRAPAPPQEPWILVTSELRARQIGSEVALPNAVDALSDRFPRIVAIRAYGSTRRTARSAHGYLTLPVHDHPAWLPMDFVVSVWRLWRQGRKAAVLWVMWPGVLGTASSLAFALTRKPLVLNIVGDPVEATQSGVVDHPFRVPARLLSRASGALLARRAQVIRYVTNNPLMERYPPGRDAQVYVLSNVDVASVKAPRELPNKGPIRLITVGSMDQPYKGVDTLIRAAGELLKRGLDVTLTVVGGGRLAADYETQARQIIPDRASFTGALPTPGHVARVVEDHDVFVLASHTEGLPRSMIEAMSLGLPCVGTRVGGIPELVDETSLVTPGDFEALADAIEAIVRTRVRYRTASERSVAVARRFSRESVTEVRMKFQQTVEELRVSPMRHQPSRL